jgi:hypothetical protein
MEAGDPNRQYGLGEGGVPDGGGCGSASSTGAWTQAGEVSTSRNEGTTLEEKSSSSADSSYGGSCALVSFNGYVWFFLRVVGLIASRLMYHFPN